MKVVVAGSYRKYWPEICNLIIQLEQNGYDVIAPKSEWKPTMVEEGFVKFQGEEEENIWDLEHKFVKKITTEADVLIVCNPGGYIGYTAGFEIGIASAIINEIPGIKLKKIYFTERLIGSYFYEKSGEYKNNITDLILNDDNYRFIKHVYYNVWKIDEFSLEEKSTERVFNEFIEESLRLFSFCSDLEVGMDKLLLKKKPEF